MKSFGSVCALFLALLTLTGNAMAQNDFTVVPTPSPVQSMVLSKDQKTLYVGMDSLLQAYDVSTEQLIGSMQIGYGLTIRPFSLSWDPQLGIVIMLTWVGLTPNVPGPYVEIVDPSLLTSQPINNISGNGSAIAQDGTVMMFGGVNLTGVNQPRIYAINPTTLVATPVYSTPYIVNQVVTGDGVTFLALLNPGGIVFLNESGTNASAPLAMPLGIFPTKGVVSPDGTTAYASGTNCSPFASSCPASSFQAGMSVVDIRSQRMTNFLNGFNPPACFNFSGTDNGFGYALEGSIVIEYNLFSLQTISDYHEATIGSWFTPDQSQDNRTLLVVHNVPDRWTDRLITGRTSSIAFWDFTHPAPFITQVISGGQPYAPGPVAPGQWIAVQGGSLASSVSYPTTSTPPTTLGTTQVVFKYAGKTTLGPMNYVGPNQVNVQVPSDVPLGSGTLSLNTNTVNADGSITASNAVQLDVVTAVPELFATTDLSEHYIVSGNPAVPGSTIVLWVGGLGPVTDPTTGASFLPATGQPAPLAPLMQTVTEPVVTIGGVPATIQFSGLTPGSVGLYQMNVIVPNIPSGSQTLTVAMPPGVQPKTVSPIMVQ